MKVNLVGGPSAGKEFDEVSNYYDVIEIADPLELVSSAFDLIDNRPHVTEIGINRTPYKIHSFSNVSEMIHFGVAPDINQEDVLHILWESYAKEHQK